MAHLAPGSVKRVAMMPGPQCNQGAERLPLVNNSAAVSHVDVFGEPASLAERLPEVPHGGGKGPRDRCGGAGGLVKRAQHQGAQGGQAAIGDTVAGGFSDDGRDGHGREAVRDPFVSLVHILVGRHGASTIATHLVHILSH